MSTDTLVTTTIAPRQNAKSAGEITSRRFCLCGCVFYYSVDYQYLNMKNLSLKSYLLLSYLLNPKNKSYLTFESIPNRKLIPK